MKKRITAIIFSVLLCLSAAIPSFAAEKSTRLKDTASLLSETERADLLYKLDEISERQQLDVTVATVNNFDGYNTVNACADDIYDNSGYGFGSEKDGLLLLISIEDRDWAISTCGYAITVFTDAGIDYIGEKITPYLSDGDYAAAFSKYAELCDEFITQARNETPYDIENMPREPLSLIWIPVSVIIGLIIALIAVGIMKSKLKTVRFKAAANSYLKNGSLNITDSSDLFLYHTVDRTAKPKDDDNSSGGSSTHTSSSGTTHGGGSGKF